MQDVTVVESAVFGSLYLLILTWIPVKMVCICLALLSVRVLVVSADDCIAVVNS